METSIQGMKNLGPTSAALLQSVGIETEEALREAGAVLAYKIVKHRHPQRVNLLFLYALEGAVRGRHWNSFSPDEKARLREAAEGALEIGPA